MADDRNYDYLPDDPDELKTMLAQESRQVDAAEAEASRYAELLDAVDAIFDVDVKHGWRILSPEAAERFAALQRIAGELTTAIPR